MNGEISVFKGQSGQELASLIDRDQFPKSHSLPDSIRLSDDLLSIADRLVKPGFLRELFRISLGRLWYREDVRRGHIVYNTNGSDAFPEIVFPDEEPLDVEHQPGLFRVGFTHEARPNTKILVHTHPTALPETPGDLFDSILQGYPLSMIINPEEIILLVATDLMPDSMKKLFGKAQADRSFDDYKNATNALKEALNTGNITLGFNSVKNAKKLGYARYVHKRNEKGHLGGKSGLMNRTDRNHDKQ